MDDKEVLHIVAALDRLKVEYILVGGVALGFQGLVRGTKDIDLFIRPEHENIERLKEALRSVFNDPEIDGISSEDLAGEYPVVRYGPPERDYMIDILARLGEAWTYEMLEWQEMMMSDIRVRVATPRTLYRMKRNTVRPQDRADAAASQEKFSLEEA